MDVAPMVKRAEWDFGNGAKAKGARVTYAYTQPGRYPLVLTVKDKQGRTVSREFSVVVEE